MRCDRLRTHLDALFDGGLPAMDASALRSHVAGCGDCAALHDAEVGLRAALRRLPVAPATPGFAEHALAHAIGLRRRDDRLPRPTWPVVVAAFGAGLVLFLLPRLFS